MRTGQEDQGRQGLAMTAGSTPAPAAKVAATQTLVTVYARGGYHSSANKPKVHIDAGNGRTACGVTYDRTFSARFTRPAADPRVTCGRCKKGQTT